MRGSCSTTWPSPTPSASGDALQRATAFAGCRALAGLAERLQFAGGDHFGQQHRRGLERLDFLFRIGAAGAVLHDENAERIAAAQDGHAEEGLIDFLAGFRPIGEGRMSLGVGERQRLGLFGDQADQAFARASWW